MYADPTDPFISAAVISATVAILGLNAAFFLHIFIAAVKDKILGKKFLPVYPREPSLPSPAMPKKWSIFGFQRTHSERTAMVSHCADYIFWHSVFRKLACVSGSHYLHFLH